MVVQHAVGETRLVELLDSKHLPYLAEFEMRLLAALEFGYSIEEMVLGFGRSEATIRRRAATVRHGIFDLLGVSESPTKLNHWTRRHFVCCTNEAQKMIETCQIFTSVRTV